MKLAWLCYSLKFEEEDDQHIEIKFKEPTNYYLYERVVQVVLAEVNNEKETT